jgi:hypothetical protein
MVNKGGLTIVAMYVKVIGNYSVENLKDTETKLTKGNKWYSFLQEIYIKNVV